MNVMLLGRALALALTLLAGSGVGGRAASDDDARRLAEFALLLGRGIACDLDTDRASAAIGAWLARTFPKGSPDRQPHLEMFAKSARFHAAQQEGGESPDSCADIAAAFEALRW